MPSNDTATRPIVAGTVDERLVPVVPVSHVVGRDVHHSPVDVVGVETAVVDRRHPTLAGTGGDPSLAADRLQCRNDAVVVRRRLPNRQVLPACRSRPRRREVALLDADLVGSEQFGRFRHHRVRSHVVTGRLQHHRRAASDVDQREPLSVRPAVRVPVIDRLPVAEAEEPGITERVAGWAALIIVLPACSVRMRRTADRRCRDRSAPPRSAPGAASDPPRCRLR